MIDLKVDSYCHNCPEFEAEVKDESFVSSDLRCCIERIITNHTITCKHKARCAGMVDYLKEQAKKNKEDSK